MTHLTATEHDRDLDLVAVFQETRRIFKLNAKVMVFNTGAQLYFFYFKNLLFFAGFFFPFLLLITIFAIIQYLAHGGPGLRGNFHQVKMTFLSQCICIPTGHNAQLLPVLVNYAYLAPADIIVNA